MKHKNNVRSVSIASTQMQLLNCIEAIFKYGYDNNDLIIWAYSKNRERQLLNLLEKLDCGRLFRKVTVYTRHNTGGFRTYISILSEKSFFKRYDVSGYNVFISGNYKLIQEKFFLRRVIRANNNVSIIVVDDGLATRETSNLRVREVTTGKMVFDETSISYKLFYLSGYLFKWKAPDTIEYFTSYSKLTISCSDTAVLNNNDFIKQNGISNKFSFENDSTIIFLGQPLVQLNILSAEVYSNYIETFIYKELDGDYANLLYIPHPAENVDESLSLELKTKLNIQAVELPVELFLLSIPQGVEKYIVGFYTSALVNIQQLSIANCRCRAVYIEEIESFSDLNMKRILKDAYNYIEESGIPIIHLK